MDTKQFCSSVKYAAENTYRNFYARKNKISDYNSENLLKTAKVTATENNEAMQKMLLGCKIWTAKNTGAAVEIEFIDSIFINTIIFKEKSDCVKKFSIYYHDKSKYRLLYTQDRIDSFRLCSFEDTKASKIKIVFDDFNGTVKVSDIGVYYFKEYNRTNFKVTSYLNSAIVENTAKTQIQTYADDKSYTDRFGILTDSIIIGAVKINTDASITASAGINNLKKDVEILKKINPSMKVRCTLMTGLVDDNFNANKKAIVKLVKNHLECYKKNLKKFIEETDIDGIDFDWEYPQLPHEWNAYGRLLIATKEVLKGADLSVALWPYGVNLSKEARACIDNVNIMAYDQFDNRGDHSSIYKCGQKSIDYFLSLGFSKQQLCYGIPFYGRTADKYNIWPPYDTEYGKWDNFRKNFTYYSDDNKKRTSTVFLNSYAMVRDKTALALYNNLGGIMIFSSTADIPYNNTYALHKAVDEILKQRR